MAFKAKILTSLFDFSKKFRELEQRMLTFVSDRLLPVPERPCSNRNFAYFESLPTEIRLHVAAYVIMSVQPLKWIYISYTADEKIGTLHGLETLTALCRVSKQCYADTIGLVWNRSTHKLEFDDCRMGVAYEVAPVQLKSGVFIAAVLAALELFHRNAPIRIIVPLGSSCH